MSWRATSEITSLEELWRLSEALIRRAQETLVVELFPQQWPALADPSPQPGERLGQACAVLLFSSDPPAPDSRLPNASTSRVSEAVLKNLPYAQLAIIADGRQVVLAAQSTTSGALLRGLWSDDPLLSRLRHNGLVSDILIHRSEGIQAFRSPNREFLGRRPSDIS